MHVFEQIQADAVCTACGDLLRTKHSGEVFPPKHCMNLGNSLSLLRNYGMVHLLVVRQAGCPGSERAAGAAVAAVRNSYIFITYLIM